MPPQTLHGDPFGSPPRPYAEYTQQNGRVYTGSVNVAWALHSITAESGDGGFVVVPGSHKASFAMPSTDPADLPEQHKGVVHPLMEPGDAVFFMGGATAHGAWRNENPEKPRRVALFNYLSKDIQPHGRGEGLIQHPTRAAL
jgi:ectoine hydroxylase-related dioxygenase (phytanoyl-CoA dioxygenase family)